MPQLGLGLGVHKGLFNPDVIPPTVIAKGMQAVWNLKSTGCGLSNSNATFKKPLVDTAAFAALGGTIAGTPGTLSYRAEVRGTNTWTDWDFSGFVLAIEGNSNTSTFNNCIIAPGNRYTAVFFDFNGIGATGVNPTFNDCLMDGTGATDVLFRGLFYAKGFDFTINRMKGINCVKNGYLNANGRAAGQTINVTDTYLDRIGSATAGGDHYEHIQFFTGNGPITANLTRIFIDGRAGIQGGAGAMTGLYYPEQINGSLFDISSTLTNCILLGAFEHVSNWVIQCDADTGRINTVTMNDNIVAPGTSGYFTKNNRAADPNTATFLGTGNVDFATGNAIVLP